MCTASGPGTLAVPVPTPGTIEPMCRPAVQIGRPALAFIEHLDLTSWANEPDDLPDRLRPLVDDNGMLTPPLPEGEGCLDSVEHCRRTFPELRILTGVEFGQPTSTGPVPARSSTRTPWTG